MRTTRYPHGLKVHWGSIFWLRDGNEQQGTYEASLDTEGYYFADYSLLTLSVMTPAQQIVWVANPDTMKHTLNPLMRQWLEQNVGPRVEKWYAREEEFDLMFLSVLFAQKSDAIKTVRYIRDLLRQEKD